MYRNIESIIIICLKEERKRGERGVGRGGEGERERERERPFTHMITRKADPRFLRGVAGLTDFASINPTWWEGFHMTF